MNVRNLSIAFMLFIALCFAAIIILFLRLQDVTADNRQKDEKIEITEQERDNLNELLESNSSQINKLSNFRTLALDMCSDVKTKYGNLQNVPDTITKDDLTSNDLIEHLDALSIGVSYESESKLQEAKALLGEGDYDFYYVKKVSNLTNSFVIYYNNTLADKAEKVAEALKKVDTNFRAIKGKTPESINQADRSEVLIIHING